MSEGVLLIGAAILIFLGLSFFFSGAETAVISANKFRLRSLHEQGDATAGKLLELLGNTQRLLVMVLIGSNIAGVLLALSFEAFIRRLWPQWAGERALGPITWSELGGLLILTPMVVIFAEILPKALFRSRADRLIGTIRPLILFWMAVLRPLIALLEYFTGLVLAPLSEERTRVMRQLTRQDLINLITPEERAEEEEEKSEEQGTGSAEKEAGSGEREAGTGKQGVEIARTGSGLGRVMANQAQQELDRLAETTDERRMIHNIIELQETRAYEIMTPLVDLVAVQLGRTDLAGFRSLARDTGYSRFPVYRDKITNLIGIVDVFRVLREANGDRRLEDFIERAHYVPETKRVDDLLQEFLRLRVKNVIVVDEYGGCSGLISREDILEEIVGELEDELDEPSRQITETAEGVYLVEGRMEIDELNHVLEADFPEDEWETLGGLVMAEMGRIPAVGDEVTIGDWRMTVATMTGHRIDKVRLMKISG